MKIGIALLTLGGPRMTEEIPIFIKNFTGVELPEKALAQIIERYKLIGGFSPLPTISEKQAEALQKLLPENYICKASFRYSTPSFEDTITNFIDIGVKKIIFFLLSPFYTSVTTGNYINKAKQFIEDNRFNVDYTFIHSWYKNETFINCWVNRIKQNSSDNNEYFYLFSAHSLPEKFSEEPYKTQIYELCEEIAKRLDIRNWELGWQSIPTNAKERWIAPQVEEIMNNIKNKGFKAVLQIPIGFTADHIETLYDIDIIHKAHAQKIGLFFKRVPSLNDAPDFINAIKDILKERGEI
jgi:ferrochelatase